MGILLLVVAYVLAFFLGPLIAGLVGCFALPLVALSRRFLPIAVAVIAASNVAQGIAAVWIGRLIFIWLNQTPYLLMVLVLAVGFAHNDLRRVRYAAVPAVRVLELVRAIGALVGIVIGAFLFVL